MDEAEEILAGDEFEAGIETEFSEQERIVEAMEKLISENAELKDLLIKVRPVVFAHLEHAMKIQESLRH